MHFSSIWTIDRTLSGATTPNQSGPRSDGNEEVLCIPPNPALLEPHHMFSVISRTLVRGILPLYRGADGVFCSPNWLGNASGKSGPGSNGNEEILYSPESSLTRPWKLNTVSCPTYVFRGLIPLQWIQSASFKLRWHCVFFVD